MASANCGLVKVGVPWTRSSAYRKGAGESWGRYGRELKLAYQYAGAGQAQAGQQAQGRAAGPDICMWMTGLGRWKATGPMLFAYRYGRCLMGFSNSV